MEENSSHPPSSASQESESEEVSENSDVQFCYERDEDWVAMEREAEEVNFDMESDSEEKEESSKCDIR